MMPRMALRVLAVAQAAELGGAELALLRVLPELDAAGVAVELAVPGDGGLAVAAHEQGVVVHELPLGPLRTGGWPRALAAWPRARSLVRELHPDAVWLNGIVPQRVVPALGDAPALLQLHDLVANRPRPWRSERFWRHVPIVACASEIAARSAAAAGAPEERLRIVPAPVEAVDRAPRPEWADGAPVVGFVGRLEPAKGVLVLLRAARLLLARRPDVRFVLVGGPAVASEPGYEQRVREEAARLGDAVEIVGSAPDARALMPWFDVLAVPSFSEAFGTVAAEALAAGTPAVVTDAGGMAEYVVPGRNGEVVPAADPERLAAALDTTLERAGEMAAAAREAVAAFATERVAGQLAGILEEVAGR
jgi:glycosyltransferase involved in cell wall biosynthesis